MSASNRRRTGFAEPKVSNLPLGNQLLDGPGDILDGRVRVNTMLEEEIDRFNIQSRQGSFDSFPNELRSARPRAISAFVGEPELRGNDHLITHGRESLANQLFIREWSVDLSSVEERHSEINR